MAPIATIPDRTTTNATTKVNNMAGAIPRLSDYGISRENGFLPDTAPLRRLPDPYYAQWEQVVENLQALILTQRLRGVIDKLPVLGTDGLIEESEWRRAYLLMGFMAHGYIWNGDKPADRLPPSISVPYLKISQHLDIAPVATYAAVCLWNWKILIRDEGIDLSNLATLATFNGSLDESWFYLVSVAIEAKGGPAIELMLNAIEDARNNDTEAVIAALKTLKEHMDGLHAIFNRMTENCDPHAFYYHIRPFLSGSKDMEHAGLPKGVLYDTGSPEDTYRKYSGGSNAQSSLIQFFDIVLGITHLPTGHRPHGHGPARKPLETPPNGHGPAVTSGHGAPDTHAHAHAHAHGAAPRQAFIQEMRSYMPGQHRKFLEHVSLVANLRTFVESHANDSEIRIAFDDACKALALWRSSHLKIVSRYVTIIAAKPQDWTRNDTGGEKKNLALASKGEKNLKGTGGTALMPFLKQARDETLEPTLAPPKPAASATGWKKFMTTKIGTRRPADEEDTTAVEYARRDARDAPVFSEPFKPSISADPKGHNGMAGAWDDDSDGYSSGGVCTY